MGICFYFTHGLTKKYASIYETLKCLLFVVTSLTANFLVVLLLPDKVYAYVMDSLQYCVAKMQTKSEMHVKYGLQFFVEGNRSTNSGYH